MNNKQQENLKKYEASVINRVECEERAFHIVNRLIDEKVDGAYLMKCGQMISKEHYNDVVEERAISHICGYPLCDNTLSDIPKKKFHIATSTNKVYEISERKNFCSNQCLKASKYFSNQISESPLWTKAREPAVDFKLLPHTQIRGMVGSEVVLKTASSSLKEEIKRLEELDIRSSSSGKRAQQNSKIQKTTPAVSKLDTSRLETKHESDAKLLQTPVGVTEQGVNVSLNDAAHISHEACRNDELKKTVSEDASSSSVAVESHECNVKSYCKNKDSALMANMDELSLKKEVVDNQTSENSTIIVGNKKLCEDLDQEDTSETSLCENADSEHKPKTSCSEDTKMDRLMNLLSKRKTILSGMIEVVTPDSVISNKTKTATTERSSKQENLKPAIVTTEISKLPSKHISHSSKHDSSKHTLSSKTTKKGPASPLEYIGAIIKSWVTAETTVYLQSSHTDDSSQGRMNFSNPRIQRGYAELCQRLNAQQQDFEDLLDDTVVSDHPIDNSNKASKSMPDYSALKKESEEFQLKVTEFITGKKPQSTDKKDEHEKKDGVYIPTVDAYDQHQIRIKIVLDRLDKFLPDLLTPLNLSVQEVSSLLRELVYTFRLEKDNIMFKPSEWTLVCMFMLKMLGKKNKNIVEAFTSESAVHYFSILLEGIGHTTSDLDVITQNILSS